MVNQNVDYSKIDDIANDGLRLFKVMMRLEFALKDLGYCKLGRGQAAEVTWDKYANEKLGQPFLEKIRTSEYAVVLIETPPKKQVVGQSGNLSWVPVGAVTSVQDLIGSLRRVRNNLFHGGKSGDPDGARNAALFTGALYVVDQILRDDDDLRTIFTGHY